MVNTDLSPTQAREERLRQMARVAMKHTDLAARLTEMGLPETEGSVQVKINRGAFPAWFLLAAPSALGCSSLRLD